MHEIGFNLENLVEQGYDGASSMTRHISGVQTRIREQYLKALYMHCSSHALNLAINDQCKLTVVRNACDTMKGTIAFLKDGHKRRIALGVSIPLFSPTRWSQKYLSIRRFRSNIETVLKTLDDLSNDSDKETRVRALSFKCLLEKSVIIYSICLIAKVSSFVEPLAQMLQTKGITVVVVKSAVQVLLETLKELRANPEEISSEMYKDSCAILKTDELALHRVTAVERFRENAPANSPEEYFHRNVLLPYLDNIIASLEERFTSNPNYFYLILPNEPSGVEEIQSFYHLDNLKSEVTLWRKSIANQSTDKDLSSLLVSAKGYPSVYKAIQILMVLPATSVEAERSFSKMKTTKTPLRSSMTSGRLSDITVIRMNKDLLGDDLVELVVKSMSGPTRRMNF